MITVHSRIYLARRSLLTLKSGGRKLRLEARYGGRVIIVTNHEFGFGRVIPLDDLLGLIAGGKPLSVVDDRLRRLAEVPTAHGDPARALKGALACAGG